MAVIRQRLNFPTLLNFLGPITFGEYTVGFQRHRQAGGFLILHLCSNFWKRLMIEKWRENYKCLWMTLQHTLKANLCTKGADINS